MPSLPKRFQLDLTGEKPVIVETKRDSTCTYVLDSLNLDDGKVIILARGTCTTRTLAGDILSEQAFEEKDFRLSQMDIIGKAEKSGLEAIYSYFVEIGQDYEHDGSIDEVMGECEFPEA